MGILSKLWHSNDGNTGILFALSAVPLLAIGGGAVDLTRQNRIETAVQSALDSAALAAARELAEQIATEGHDHVDFVKAEEHAKRIFDAATARFDLDLPFNFQHQETLVSVSSNGVMPTSFLPVIGISELHIGGYAEAETEQETENCVYVTAPHEQGVTLKASSEFSADCGVWVESTNDRAISATASSDMWAREICSNGDLFLWATSTVTPMPSACGGQYVDPLRSLGRPIDAAATCDFQDINLKGQVQLRPGVYCGTTTIAPASHAEMRPGEYVFRGGALKIASGSSAAGDDILLYFTGGEGGLQVGDGANFEGHGRLTGEFAGVLLYVDRDCHGCSNSIRAGGTATIEGTVYAPTAPFSIQSRASTISASHALFIVYALTLESSASFTIEQLNVGTVPAAYTDASVVRLVK